MKIGAVNLQKNAYPSALNTNKRNEALEKDVFIKNSAISMLGSLPELPSPFKDDADEINEIINSYHYGKIDIVDNTPENFRVRTVQETLTISAFRNSDPNLKYGTCEELAYKAGREIQEKFGDKYIVMVVRGICPKENLTHFYLALYENNDKNKARIQGFEQKEEQVVKTKNTINEAAAKMSVASKDMYTMAKNIFARYGQDSQMGKAVLQIILTMQKAGVPKKELKDFKNLCERNNTPQIYEALEAKVKAIQDIQAEVTKAGNDAAHSVRVTPSDFEGALLVDPSYKTMRMYPKGMLYKDYPQEQIISLEEQNPFKSEDYVVPASIITSNSERKIGFALGYVGDLAPELTEKLKGKLNDETTLCLNFKLMSPERANASLSYVPLNSKHSETLNAETLLGKDHKLVKFLNRANGR